MPSDKDLPVFPSLDAAADHHNAKGYRSVWINSLTRILQWTSRNPILYRGERFHVVYFGVFAALAVLLQVTAAVFYMWTRGVSAVDLALLSVAGMAGNVVGVKVFHLSVVRGHSGGIRAALNQTSMYSQGGVIGTFTGLVVYTWLSGINSLIVLDSAALSGALCLAIGRLGCHNYGCCHGHPTRSPISVRYNHPAAKVVRLHPELSNVPLVPTQFYSFFANASIFALLLYLAQLNTYHGVLLLVFALTHNGFRVFIERFRMRTNEPCYARIAVVIAAVAVLYTLAHIPAGWHLSEPPVHPVSFASLRVFLTTQPVVIVVCCLLGLISGLFYGVHGRTLGRHFG